MVKRIIVVFFILFLISSLRTFAQFLPKDSAKLNYNQIMFECPSVDDVEEYIFCVSFDSVEVKNEKHYLIKQKEKHPVANIKELPLGNKYKWRVLMRKSNRTSIISDWHYFEILNSKLHSDPQNDLTKTKAIRDIRLQKDGSLTMLNYPNAIKTNLEVSNAWELPHDDIFPNKEFWGFHHSFEILPNGNYMAMANEKVNFSNETSKDTSHSVAVDFCNLVEFDSTGKLIWIWKMKDHFPYELLVDSRIKNDNGVVDPHSNSFCHDSSGNYVYISYRDISRIIKIEKKTKKIVASYGFKLKDEDEIAETALFRLQHDIQYFGNNDFLIFNNDLIDSGKISSVEVVQFPDKNKDSFKLKWKFDLNYMKDFEGKVERMGSVKKLSNGNYLICAGSANRILEVSEKKEVLWDFYIQQLDSGYKVNKFFSVYRAYFSKSLYPNYFVLYKNGKNLFLVNKGDFESEFEIEFSSTSSSELNKKEIVRLKKDASQKISDNAKYEIVKVKSLNSGIIKNHRFK